MSFLDEKKLDPVGKEDNDINNDGKVNKTDKYLKNRREKIAKNLKEEDLEEGKLKNFVLGLGLSAAALAGISNMNNNDPVVKRLKAEYEQAEPAKQDSIKKLITKRLIFLDTGKFDDNTPMKEDKKTVELPADTTFTLDLKHLMKKHMDEGKSQEDVVKLTKALMKKLHDKGEVMVKGTKVMFKEGKKKKSGYMGYTEMAESAASNLEIKSLAKKIYLALKNKGLKNIKLVAMDLGDKMDFGKAGKTIGDISDSNNSHAAIFYNDFIDLVIAGPEKGPVEKFIADIKGAFPKFEYSGFESKTGINWNPNGHTVSIRINPGKTTSEADVPQDTQLALPEPDAPDYLGDDGMDYEGGMAKSQMLKMKKYAMALCDMIEDETQLESWVQSKLTKASDYMSSVYHYLDYQRTKNLDEASSRVIGNLPKIDWDEIEPNISNRPDYQEGTIYGTSEDGRNWAAHGSYTEFDGYEVIGDVEEI